ncbi:hypothetical protein [Massilia sp.]|uniref:hypothetical protein n=1 Tax=Massilia sp. TaxID=1882437 RepID=UPI00391DA6A7
MRITFKLIEKAVDLATRVFVTVRETNANATPADQSNLISLIDDVSRRIDSLASDIAGQVSYQLEKQQLEKLAAQTKVVKLALEFGNESMLGPAVASISEQIEYSRLRLSEGKHEWFAPWMIAESVRIEALRMMAHSQRALDVVQRETLNFRISILDHAGKLIVSSVDNPWLGIADFVDGRNEDVLLGLGEIEEFQAFEVEPEEDASRKAKPRSPAKTTAIAAPAEEKAALAPASGWPFPTSSRP